MAFDAPDDQWLRLHPASVFVNLIPQTWRVLRMAWPLGLAILWRGESGMWLDTIDIGLVLFFFLLTVGGTVKHWVLLRYRFHGGRLEIRSGLIYRRLRVIDPVRVQNVELVRNLFHKLTGLVEVRIETASGTEIEGDLSALNLTAAEALRQGLESARRTGEEWEDTEIPLLENGWIDLFRYGATAGRFGTALVLFGILFETITRLEPEQWGQFSQMALGLKGFALLFAVFSGAWLWGLLSAVVRHFHFRLVEVPGALVVEGGLFTRRRMELPLHKVQLVSVEEPLLRRWAGFGSLTIETAAARMGRGGTERTAAMIPVVEHASLPEMTREAIPNLDVDPWTQTLYRPHPRALLRGILRAFIRGSVLAGGIHWWFGGFAALAWLVLPVGALLAYLDYRHQGWLVSEGSVVSRRGYVNRSSVIVHRSKIQSLSCHQGPVLRRIGLGRLSVNVAGRSVGLPLISWEQAQDRLLQLTEPPDAALDATTEEQLA